MGRPMGVQPMQQPMGRPLQGLVRQLCGADEPFEGEAAQQGVAGQQRFQVQVAVARVRVAGVEEGGGEERQG